MPTFTRLRLKRMATRLKPRSSLARFTVYMAGLSGGFWAAEKLLEAFGRTQSAATFAFWTAALLFATAVLSISLLVRWAREELTDDIQAWVEGLHRANIKFCLLSNSVLSRRVERVAQIFGCPNIRKAQKPRPDGFHRAMKAMGTTPATTAVIGDQMFTDILGGNRVGLYTIMVEPLAKGEFVYTRLVHRPPETLLLRLFRKRGHLR